MHSKYFVRDGNADDAAVFLGSANYTNDSWGLQENNLLQVRSRPLASYFSKNFTELFAAGRIADRPTDRDVDVSQRRRRAGDVWLLRRNKAPRS